MKIAFPLYVAAWLLSAGLCAVPAFAGPLLTIDFNKENPWKDATAQTSVKNIKAKLEWLPVGTIDQFRTGTRTGAMSFTVDSSNASGAWEALAVSGPLAVTNTESDLGKLSLSFMLSASSARPVRVLIESLAASVRLTFGVARDAAGTGWPVAMDNSLAIDNVGYASPAYYVGPAGDDSHDGLTERTAFAHPQAALDVAGPGDVILLMDGTYAEGRQSPTQTASAVASFRAPGSPAAWITLKNYPGQHPVILARGTQGIRFAQGTKKPASVRPSSRTSKCAACTFAGTATRRARSSPRGSAPTTRCSIP